MMRTPRARCDLIVEKYLTGCVFGSVPAAVVYSRAVGQNIRLISEHIAQAQASGLPIVLNRISNADPQYKANRRTACENRRNIIYGDPSCDEYPFASTKQGARANPNLGRSFRSGCGDYKAKPGSTVLTYGRAGPGWSICRVPIEAQSAQGGLMSSYYRGYRVIAGDPMIIRAR